jgi:hypothetical protein
VIRPQSESSTFCLRATYAVVRGARLGMLDLECRMYGERHVFPVKDPPLRSPEIPRAGGKNVVVDRVLRLDKSREVLVRRHDVRGP